MKYLPIKHTALASDNKISIFDKHCMKRARKNNVRLCHIRQSQSQVVANLQVTTSTFVNSDNQMLSLEAPKTSYSFIKLANNDQ